MGCKHSQQARIVPVGPAGLKNTTSENDMADRRRRRGKSSKSRKSMGSCGSLDDDRSLDSDRGGSASSKKSNDSGLGDLGEFNHGFITENSDPDAVKRIEENFVERDDLGKMDVMVIGLNLFYYQLIFYKYTQTHTI